MQKNTFFPQKFTYEEWPDTIASGWGATSFGSAISNTLQYVNIPPVSDETCNAPASYNGTIISDAMICAGTVLHQEIQTIERILYCNALKFSLWYF